MKENSKNRMQKAFFFLYFSSTKQQNKHGYHVVLIYVCIHNSICFCCNLNGTQETRVHISNRLLYFILFSNNTLYAVFQEYWPGFHNFLAILEILINVERHFDPLTRSILVFLNTICSNILNRF